MKKSFNEKKQRIIEILNIINLRQVLDFFIFPIVAIISFLLKPFFKDIWIIAENQNEACDNGYIFYKYLRENRPDINAYYVINKKSKDYKKVEKLGNIIGYRSLKHWIYYLNAKKIIITQKYANPSPALFYILHVKNLLKIPRVFLQHGITKDNGNLFYYNRTKFRIFICGAKKEYDYIKEKFEYPAQNVAYTGFARFDNLILDKNSKHEKCILLAPTWRKWIKNQNDFNTFMEKFYRITNNPDLIEQLNKNNIKLQVVLHKNLKKFNIKKDTLSTKIAINHNDEIDIQKIINETDLLITDFSSIFFDIAYRKRPIIYYQFDTGSYRKNQLPEGYFSYKDNGFGDIIDNTSLVVEKIIYYIQNNFNIEEKYAKRMDDFFERKDKNNCKRILEEIEKI